MRKQRYFCALNIRCNTTRRLISRWSLEVLKSPDGHLYRLLPLLSSLSSYFSLIFYLLRVLSCLSPCLSPSFSLTAPFFFLPSSLLAIFLPHSLSPPLLPLCFHPPYLTSSPPPPSFLSSRRLPSAGCISYDKQQAGEK